MKKKLFLNPILFFLINSFSLHSFLTYEADEWGNAFLIKVTNQTTSDLELNFPDSSSSKRIIRPGGLLGKSPLLETTGKSASEASVAGMANTMVKQFIPVITDRNSIRSDEYPTIENTNIKRKPIISGFGSTTVAGITSDININIEPMMGRGGAWFNQREFVSPSCISFGMYIKDRGSGAIVFSDNIKKGARLIIEFGAEDNNKINIKLDGSIVGSVNFSDYPLAKLLPGRFNNFWLSFSETDLILGYGSIVGQRILHCATILNLKNITKYLGLMSFEVPIMISALKILPPIKLTISDNKTALLAENAEKEFSFVSKGVAGVFVEPSSEISSNFEIKIFGEEKALLVFKKNLDVLEINIKDKESSTVFYESLKLLPSLSNIILNLKGNLIQVAFASPNYDKVFFQKIIPCSLFSNSSQMVTSGFAKNDKLYLGSLILSSLDSNAGSQNMLLRSSESLLVQRPIEYEFDQQGPAIICTDKIGRQSFILGKAAQQKAYYSFNAVISNNGLMNIKWDLDPINPTKMTIKAAVGLAGIAQQEFISQANQAQNLGEEEYKKEMESGAAPAALKTSLSATAQNIAFSLAAGASGIVANTGAAAIEDSFRQATESYVFTEKMNASKNISSDIPQEAKINKTLVDNQVGMIKNKLIKTREDYDFVMGEAKSIVGLINHPFVSSGEVKGQLFKIVNDLVDFKNKFTQQTKTKNAYGQSIMQATSGIAFSIISLLSMICNNSFLITSGNKLDSIFASNFLTISNKYSREYISKNVSEINQSSSSITLPTSKDFIFWSEQLIPKGNGSIIFKARGQSELGIVLLSQSNLSYFNSRLPQKDEALYQVVFGDNQNRELTIRPSFNSTPTKRVRSTEEKDFSLDQLEFKLYWVNVEDGLITAGINNLGSTECISWQDPYFKASDLVAGIYNKSSDVEILSFSSGPPASSISKELSSLINFLKDPKSADYLLIKKNDPNFLCGEIPTSGGTMVSQLLFEKEATGFTIKIKPPNKPDIYFLKILQKIRKVKPSDESNDNKTEEPFFELAVLAGKNNKIIKEGSFELSQKEIPFSVEIIDGIIKISTQPIWEDAFDFAVMFSELKSESFSIEISVDDLELKLLKPVILEAKRNINYPFLSFLSDGAIQIPLSKAALAAKKERDVATALSKMLDEEKKKNPLLKDLQKEEQQAFADLLFYAAMDDNYDQLAFSDLDYSLGKSRNWQEVLTSDPLSIDRLSSNDILDTGPAPKASFEEAEHNVSAASKKLAMMGAAQQLAMVSMDLMDTGRNIAGGAAGVKYLKRKASGYYDSHPDEKAEDAKAASDFAPIREAKSMKTSFSSLHDIATSGKSNDLSRGRKDSDGKVLMSKDSEGNDRVILKNDFSEAKAQVKMWMKKKEKEQDGIDIEISSLMSKMKNMAERARTGAREKIKKVPGEIKDSIKEKWNKSSKKEKAANVAGKVLAIGMAMGGGSDEENSDSNVAADINDGIDKNSLSKSDQLKLKSGIEINTSSFSEALDPNTPTITNSN